MDFKADVMVFSEAAHEDFGTTAAAKVLRIRALTHSSGCIHRVGRDKLTEIAMKIPLSCEVSTHLYFYPAHTELYLCDEYVFINRIGNRALFRVRFPHSGYYAFKIYARSRHNDEPWPNVFNYVIEVLEVDDVVLPFPIPVECYDGQDGFELREPTVRYLPCYTKVYFNLWVPGAERVLVVNEGKRTQLVRDGFQGDTWTAEVRTNSPGSELRIGAKFHGGETKLLTILLLYQVVHLERKKENEKPGTSSKCALRETCRTKPESESGGETDTDEQDRSSTPSDLHSLVNKPKESESKNKIQQMAAIRQDEEQKMAQKKETDDVRAELLDSIKSHKLNRLQRAISAVHELRLSTALKNEVRAAHKTAEALRRLERLRDAILLMDATTLAEIRRYAQPHPVVHDIMVAVLLLLGHDEGQTRKWSNCQKLCNALGRSGLKKKIQEFDLEAVHAEILERAWQIIQGVNVADVIQISQGVTAFYSWVTGVYKEYNEIHRNQQTPEPANKKRQKELLFNRP